MKQWEIYLFPFPENQQHPFVIISNDGICDNPAHAFVNALICQTVRPQSRPKKVNEVYLGPEDGLDWKTLVKCDYVHSLGKEDIISRVGRVCPQRVMQIRQLLASFF